MNKFSFAIENFADYDKLEKIIKLHWHERFSYTILTTPREELFDVSASLPHVKFPVSILKYLFSVAFSVLLRRY